MSSQKPALLPEVELLFSLASSPTPGIPFTDPYQGFDFLLKGKLAFVRVPDLSEEQAASIEVLGECASELDLVKIVAGFIDKHSLEIPLAVFCHHRSIPPDDYPIWASLPYFFWLNAHEDSKKLISEIDGHLFTSSARYRALVDAVSENPEDGGADLIFSLENQIDFSRLYLEFNGL